MIGNAARAGVLGLALLGLHTSVPAQVGRDIAEELMHKSGLWEQLASISTQASAGFDAASKGDASISKQERARLEKVFASAYEPGRLRSGAAAGLQSRMDPRSAADCLAWFNSPLGRTIAHLEEAASADTANPATRLRQGMDLYSHASDTRQSLLKRVVEASRAAEGVTSIMISTAIGVQQGLIIAQPSHLGPSADEVAAALQKKRPQMVQTYTGVMLASLASAYATLSDADLQRYADFLASASATRFTDISMQALEQALAAAAVDLGRGFQEVKAGRPL